MRIFTTVLSLCVLVIFTNCGEEGVGFNIGKEFPLEIPVDLGTFPTTIPGVNPPEFSESASYDINKVDEFSGESIEEVVFNGVSYGITGVNESGESGENITVEDLSLVISYNGDVLATIDVASDLPTDKLANLSAIPVTGLDADNLSQILKDGGEIDTEVTFDFGEVPGSGFDFNFVFYFDVIAKIRE
ncbi:MAG: hypothetical protein JXR03_05470 [Cyclobacteriaceae bacterium]